MPRKGFISDEGEDIYKNYKLKNRFHHFTRNIPLLLFVSFSKGIGFGVDIETLFINFREISYIEAKNLFVYSYFKKGCSCDP